MVNPHILHHQTLGLNSERHSLRLSLLMFQLTAGFGMVAEVSHRILKLYSIYMAYVFRKSSTSRRDFMPSIRGNSSPGIDKFRRYLLTLSMWYTCIITTVGEEEVSMPLNAL
jgi:hypothetical protein